MQLLLQFLFMAGRYLCNPERSIYSQRTGFKLDRPVLSRQQHRQHQSLGFLMKRGKTTSCFCSPCFSQQFVVPALCYPSEVEWHLQLPPLRSVPPQSFLEKGNAHCSRPLSTPPVLKPIKTNSAVERYQDICSPRALPREKARLLFGCPNCGAPAHLPLFPGSLTEWICNCTHVFLMLPGQQALLYLQLQLINFFSCCFLFLHCLILTCFYVQL